IEHSVPVVGINGSKGSGKTTAAMILKMLLETKYGQNVAVISIDDFYYSQEKRYELAQSLHPLFITRGVPGTHDIELALQILEQLKKLVKGEVALLPRFDKSRDTIKPQAQWEKVEGPVSTIIFEGWCVASPAMDAASLTHPVNKLESVEDKDAIWRKTYNQFLQQQYQVLYKQINWLLMLKSPDFDVVYHWRLLQEQKLAESLPDEEKTQLLDEQQLRRFIQHFQRLTEHNLFTIPALSDAIITLDEHHRMTDLQIKDSKIYVDDKSS
ncbi:MAG: glycerate kinase, partial [Thiotrichaceae bacterium]|nr:glycerate kinase [Thiotrichaceae bacterium]